MIKLTGFLPRVTVPKAEHIRMNNLKNCYGEINVWAQDGGKAYLSLSDGDLTVYNICGDINELKEFTEIISPLSIYGDYNTVSRLKPDVKPFFVMCKKAKFRENISGDELKSDEIYNILKSAGLEMPDYPLFAVDFCRRKNKGFADFFGIKGKCAAVSFSAGDYALINGVASLEKGMGSVALCGIENKNPDRTLVACCKEELIPFYEKNGYQKTYRIGCWTYNEH